MNREKQVLNFSYYVLAPAAALASYTPNSCSPSPPGFSFPAGAPKLKDEYAPVHLTFM